MAMRWGDLTGVRTASVGSGRAVLLVHGWWGGSWVWDGWMSRFSGRGHETTALDLTGYHGSGSTRDVGRVPFAQHLADVHTVLATLDRPVLVGHSMGGLLAAKAASEADVAGCVVLAGIPPRGIVSATTTRAFLPYLLPMLRRQPLMPDEPTMRRLDLNRLPEDQQATTYARMVPAPGVQGVETGLFGVPVRKVRCPLLSIGGSDDALTPPWIAGAIGRRLGGTSHVYDDHAHYLVREPGWEVIADDVLDWIDALPSR